MLKYVDIYEVKRSQRYLLAVLKTTDRERLYLDINGLDKFSVILLCSLSLNTIDLHLGEK